MLSAVGPRLERHSIFHSQNLEEAHGFLRSKDFWVDFPSPDRLPLDLHINGIYLPGSYVGYFCYGRSVVLKATPARTDYWFQFSAQRHFEIEIGKERLLCDARKAVVLSPTQENMIRSEAGCGRMALSLTRDALVRQLCALLGRPLAAPISFAPAMDLSRGYGLSLSRYIRAAVDDFEQEESLARKPLAMSAFEQFIITALLLSHPHNYSAELQRPEKPIAPRDVRRAIDYMEGHAMSAITLADIVHASGVSGRGLFKHFREFTQTSPMGYLRAARFRGAREALERAQPEERIADIAARWGFDHFGRFAIEYRRRFGEKPSETKRRASARATRRSKS